MSKTDTFDFIIVGAGSAGCVLADYLSRDPLVSVCVLEAGKSDWWPMIHMPAEMASLLLGTRHNWALETVPQKHLNNRKIYIPQGKGIGGSSSINGMIYSRGNAFDYNLWRQLGCEGWGYDDVLSVFKEVENNHVVDDDRFHGQDGPLHINNFAYTSELTHAFIEACVELGLPRNGDFNGAVQDGTGLFSYTLNRKPRSRRWSSARAFLDRARRRPNVTVLTESPVHRVKLEKNKAVGVEIIAKNGLARSLSAGKEVILSAGVFHTPKILLLSGIGPSDELGQVDVKTLVDLPGVGKNLQDHLDIGVLYEASKPITYDGQNGVLPTLRHGLEYLVTGTGMVNTTACEAAAYTRSSPSVAAPDISMHFLPVWVVDHGRQVPPGHGMTLHNNNLRPNSRGDVRLASNDPRQRPLIDPNYFSDATDHPVLIECVRWGRAVFESRSFREFVKGPYLPGPAVESEADVIEYIRQYGETDYHPVGTCKMGVDEMAVVDPQLRVRGVEGLRIADASIMPTLTSGNTNAPSIMIGTKASRMIMQSHGLAEKAARA